SSFCILIMRRYPSMRCQLLRSTLFPYTTLFRSVPAALVHQEAAHGQAAGDPLGEGHPVGDDAVLLEGEEGAGAANAGLHLVHQRSEEHTSELQSRFDLVCRLLLEKKKRSAAMWL